MNSNGLRLSKFLAQNGICSRREAERMIENGEVKVNGHKIIEVVTFLKPGDKVTVSGKNMIYEVVDKSSAKYQSNVKVWLLNKPKETIVTNYDPKGRTTVFDILPSNMPYVVSVGRLDFNTEGLLLLTNNGDLARFLELPENKITRVYRCRLFTGRNDIINTKLVEKLARGVVIDGVHYQPIEMKIEHSSKNDNYTWVIVKLLEGKNREIRKIFEYFNIEVTRLIRIAYGEFQLGNIETRSLVEADHTIVKKYLGMISKFSL